MNSEVEDYPLTGRFLMGRLRHALSREEKQALEDLIEETALVDPGCAILQRGDLVNCSTMLVEGVMLRVIHDKGRRFAVGIQVPGDFVDLHAFPLKRLDHDIVAVGKVRVGVASHARIDRVLSKNPHLARILWFSTLLDAAIHREWIMKLEQLTAAHRAAHLFCEIWHRLEMVALARNDGFRTALSQIDLADICGTSAVNMSRALSKLKGEGIARFHRGHMVAQDRARLEAYGRFDPTYLYGPGELRMRDELSL